MLVKCKDGVIKSFNFYGASNQEVECSILFIDVNSARRFNQALSILDRIRNNETHEELDYGTKLVDCILKLTGLKKDIMAILAFIVAIPITKVKKGGEEDVLNLGNFKEKLQEIAMEEVKAEPPKASTSFMHFKPAPAEKPTGSSTSNSKGYHVLP